MRIFIDKDERAEAVSRYNDLCIIGGDFNYNENKIAKKYGFASILDYEEPRDKELINAACVVANEIFFTKLDPYIDESITTLAKYYSYLTGDDPHIEQVKIAKMICYCAQLNDKAWNYRELNLNSSDKASGILRAEIYKYDMYVATDYDLSSNEPENLNIDSFALAYCRSIFTDYTLPCDDNKNLTVFSTRTAQKYPFNNIDKMYCILEGDESYLATELFNDEEIYENGYNVHFANTIYTGVFIVLFDSKEKALEVASKLGPDSNYEVRELDSTNKELVKFKTIFGEAYTFLNDLKGLIYTYRDYLDYHYDYVPNVTGCRWIHKNLIDTIDELSKDE